MFEIYKRFVGKKSGPNRMYPVTEGEIAKAEKLLGHRFPAELRSFYLEVGCGFYSQGSRDKVRNHNIINSILSPDEIADLVCNEENEYRPSEGFVEGVLPFFDLGSETYLVLRPRSKKKPNAVYWPDGETKVTDTLLLFFSSLFEHADFYRLKSD